MVGELEQPPRVIYLDEAVSHLHDYAPRAPFADTTADEPAFILYTSGTTKEPKGVVHTHGYTFAKRMQAEHWLDARSDDLVWCTAGTGWAKSIWNVLLGPWSCGAEIVLHEGPFDPRERFELIDRLGVTVLCQAPTEYRLMAKLDGPRAARALAPAARGRGRGAAQPRGDQDLSRHVRPHDLRRLRADRELAARRQRRRAAGATRVDGAAHAGTRRSRHRRRRRAGRRRRRGRHRDPRSAADAVRRLLAAARRDELGLPRRVVRDRRSCAPRRGRLLLVHRSCGRRDPLGRVPDRSVRGRERASRASGRRGERRRR